MEQFDNTPRFRNMSGRNTSQPLLNNDVSVEEELQDLRRLGNINARSNLFAIFFGILGISVAIVAFFFPLNSDSDSFSNGFFCTMDMECLNTESVLTCSSSFCNLTTQKCELVLLETSECQTSSDCTDGQVCNDECSCITPPVCTMDSECLDVDEVLSCSTSFCNTTSGQCELELLPNSECQTNSECDGLMECNGCICIPPVDANATLACVVDSDCINVESTNPCISAFCNITTERCDTQLNMGFDCNGDDSQCGTDEICSSCVCVPDPDICITDNDCPPLNFTNCLANVCDQGTCVIDLAMGATCSDTSFCSSGEYCNENCACETFPSSSGGFTLIQSGNVATSGAAVVNFDYQLFADGDVRFLTWQDSSLGNSIANTIIFTSMFINPADRPGDFSALPRFYCNVLNSGTPAVGTVQVTSDGDLIFWVGAQTFFTNSGNHAIRSGSVTWSVVQFVN